MDFRLGFEIFSYNNIGTRVWHTTIYLLHYSVTLKYIILMIMHKYFLIFIVLYEQSDTIILTRRLDSRHFKINWFLSGHDPGKKKVEK